MNLFEIRLGPGLGGDLKLTIVEQLPKARITTEHLCKDQKAVFEVLQQLIDKYQKVSA